MYVLKNAVKNLGRNRGRNILLGIIIFVLILSTTVALVINSTQKELLTTIRPGSARRSRLVWILIN